MSGGRDVPSHDHFAGVTSFWPFLASLYPAADVIAEGTITVNLGPIEPGQRITVEWRRKPVFIHHRTP
jgi:ubiquinol-cytochrome c reductase iron-sulfur subunit